MMLSLLYLFLQGEQDQDVKFFHHKELDITASGTKSIALYPSCCGPSKHHLGHLFYLHQDWKAHTTAQNLHFDL